MIRFRLFAGFALAIATLLSQVAPATAGQKVPFGGVLAGPYTVDPIPGTPTANLVVSAVGVANHLGFFELEIPHVVNFVTTNATGEYHFTAANGDQLDGTFSGHSTPIGTEGIYVLVVEDVTITGGTGRFNGVTGSITSVRIVDRANLETTGYFTGSISKPKKK